MPNNNNNFYVAEKSVNVGYPGKFESANNKHGNFIVKEGAEDNYDLKDYFTPEERATFYGHVKGVLKSLEAKYPPSQTVIYKEAETLTNEKGYTYQKAVENGSQLKESIYNALSEEDRKGYKKVVIPEMNYQIQGNHYTKDGKDYDSFQLTITSNKHEAIRVNYNKNCEATSVSYNKDNSFVNKQPAPDNKWMFLNNDIKFSSEVLKNFATDLSAMVVRGERTGRALPSIFKEVNDYVKENSPKMQNAEGKEVAKIYCTGFHYAGSPMKDKDGNVLKDEQGNTRTYQRDNFGFFNHANENITVNLVDGEIAGFYLRNSADKEGNIYSNDLKTIYDKAIDKDFVSLLNDGIANYTKEANKVSEEMTKNEADKDNEFVEYDENEGQSLPF